MMNLEDEQVFCGLAENLEGVSAACRWTESPVTYAFANFIPELGESTQRALTRAAFDLYEKVCGVRIVEMSDVNRANIVISAGRGRRMGFDGPSGTLAYSGLPCGNVRQVQLVYDMDEVWRGDGVGDGIQYFIVAVHEIGHALGLPHAPAGSANILAPVYNASLKTFGPWDIEQSVARYGQPKPPASTPEPGETSLFDPSKAIFEYLGERYVLTKAR